jgi:hypothetical protein
MRTIQTPLIITGIRAKIDGSLGISATTPELSKEEKVEVMELQNLNLDATFKPVDFETKDVKEIKGEFDQKTPSQRLRSRMFVFYKESGKNLDDFNGWYIKQMDKIGQQYLDKIEK